MLRVIGVIAAAFLIARWPRVLAALAAGAAGRARRGDLSGDVLVIRFVIQRLATGEYWAGSNRWAAHPSGALWFERYGDAEIRGLRHLPDRRSDWAVRELKADASGVNLQTHKESA